LATLAQELALPLEFFSREEIGVVQDAMPTPSAAVEKHIGVKSVCEAAAILASRSGALIVPKRSSRNATVAIGPNQLYIVGIGPGSLEHLTLRATEVLQSVACVAGYSLYLDLIQPLIAGKQTLRSE